jgi:hypothetical protein
MSDADRAALREALISMAVSLAGMAVTILFLRHGGDLAARVRARRNARRAAARAEKLALDRAVEEFAGQVSDFDRERRGS